VFTFVSECVIERNGARARGEKRKKRRARGDNERKKEIKSVCTRYRERASGASKHTLGQSKVNQLLMNCTKKILSC